MLRSERFQRDPRFNQRALDAEEINREQIESVRLVNLSIKELQNHFFFGLRLAVLAESRGINEAYSRPVSKIQRNKMV